MTGLGQEKRIIEKVLLRNGASYQCVHDSVIVISDCAWPHLIGFTLDAPLTAEDFNLRVALTEVHSIITCIEETE